MGHFTEIRHISADRVTTATSTSQIVGMAVSDWYDDHESERGDERSGYGHKTELVAPDAVNGYIDDNDEKVNNESLVVPVCRAEDVKLTTQKVKMTVPGSIIASAQNGTPDYRFKELVRKQFGSTVIDAKFVKLPKARKAVASSSAGKAIIKYKLVSVSNWNGAVTYHDINSGMNRNIKNEFDSQAEARAEGIRIVNSDEEGYKGFTNLEVHAYIVREGGNKALVSISRPTVEDAEMELSVQFATPKPNAKVAFYAVAFDYHR